MKKNFKFLLALTVLGITGCSSTQKNSGYYSKSGCFISDEKPMIASNKILDTEFIKNKHLNISYETVVNSQKLDIYLPNEGVGPFPVIIGVHGGGFKHGSKDGAMNQSILVC